MEQWLYNVIHAPFFDFIIGALISGLSLLFITLKTTIFSKLFKSTSNSEHHNIELIKMYKEESNNCQEELKRLRELYNEQETTIEDVESKYKSLALRIQLMESILKQQEKKLKEAREIINSFNKKSPD